MAGLEKRAAPEIGSSPHDNDRGPFEPSRLRGPRPRPSTRAENGCAVADHLGFGGEQGAEKKFSKRRLDLGCGLHKAPGWIGIDSNRDAIPADVLADLNRPLPFPDDTFDEVRAVHVIEHVGDIMQTMAEIHRVARHGARLYLATPHYTDSSSWRDPTHRWHLNTYSFRFWTAIGLHHERHWYTRLELREVALHVELARLWRYAGFQWLVNRFEPCRRFWEQYLCFLLRAKQIEFTFKVVKNGPGGVHGR